MLCGCLIIVGRVRRPPSHLIAPAIRDDLGDGPRIVNAVSGSAHPAATEVQILSPRPVCFPRS
jgi:hypothetical protein